MFRSACESREPVGSGRNIVTIRIHKMAFIKCKLNNLPDNQIRVKLRLGKRTIRSPAMDINELTLNELSFAFRRRDVTLDECEGRLELIRKNEVVDLGSFEVSIS
jgi:hypothetical protein